MAGEATFVSSGEKTASTVIKAGRCRLGGVLISTDGVNPAVVNLYNSASGATGKKLVPQLTVAGADNIGGAVVPNVAANQGIYLEIVSGNPRVVVYHD
jgi:hypothetical protein